MVTAGSKSENTWIGTVQWRRISWGRKGGFTCSGRGGAVIALALAVAVSLTVGLTAVASDVRAGDDPAFRTWRSRQGATSQARLVDIQGQEVYLQTKDGHKLKFRVADLSDADRAFLTDANLPDSANLRQKLDAWVVPTISLRRASLQQAASTISEVVNQSVPEAQLRVRVDESQVANAETVTLRMEQVRVSELLRTVATVANAACAIISNEIVFVAVGDPRSVDLYSNTGAAPAALAETKVATTLGFRFEFFSLSARDEDELAKILPRPDPAVPHTYSSNAETTKMALKKFNMLAGKRQVAKFDLKTNSGINVGDNNKRGRDEVSVQCTPFIGADGRISAVVQCMIFDHDDDEHGSKGYDGQCLFEGASSQVLLQTRHTAEAAGRRPGKRYVIRVTCNTVSQKH